MQKDRTRAMTRNRARVRRALWMVMLRERAPVVLVVGVLLAFTGWLIVGHWDRRLAQCLEAYDRAATAADTARVDATPITARGRSTCRDDRRNGTLDRYRRSVEAGRVASSG